MKTAKIFLGVCWFFSALITGLGVIIYFGAPARLFNYPFFNTALLIFLLTFTIMTPLILYTLFGDAVTKKQSEINAEVQSLHEAKVAYRNAEIRLINAANKLENLAK